MIILGKIFKTKIYKSVRSGCLPICEGNLRQLRTLREILYSGVLIRYHDKLQWRYIFYIIFLFNLSSLLLNVLNVLWIYDLLLLDLPSELLKDALEYLMPLQRRLLRFRLSHLFR